MGLLTLVASRTASHFRCFRRLCLVLFRH